MSFKIYTKTGDKGSTSLIGGTKVSKAHIRIESYGTVDELNSFIGFCIDQLSQHNIHHVLREVQDRLFTIGSSLACDPEKETKMKIPDFHEEDITLLENEMDLMDKELLPMKSFILPGGHLAASSLHIARCVCRRAERICVHMQNDGAEVPDLIIKYLNRLSDYLFVLSRYAAHQLKVAEIPWKARL